MNQKWHALLIFTLVCAAISARSAQPVVESFSGGANGWIGSVGFGSDFWSFTGGVSRVTLFDSGPVPTSATLSNSPTATSGSFTGNMDAANVSVVGFRFLAPTHLPSGNVILEWGGSTSVFQRGFSVTQTGQWYSFSASIANEDASQWFPIKGSLTDFAAARQAMRFVSIRVSRAGTSTRDYMFDDIFLAGHPANSGLEKSTGTSFRIQGETLLSNLTYFVESSPEVTGTWSAATSFVATNSLQWVNVTNDAARLFYRLRFP